MNEDYYAFNGLPKDKVERARNFQRRNWPRINVDNKDWEIIINTKDPSQHKVRELYTGKKNIEEWKLLPLQVTNLVNRHTLHNQMYIDTNFVAIHFELSRIWIVNLASRKNFFIEIPALENQIKAKLGNEDQEFPQFDWTTAMDYSSMINWMSTKQKFVKLKYRINFRWGKRKTQVDSHLILNLDDQKEITDITVEKTKLIPETDPMRLVAKKILGMALED